MAKKPIEAKSKRQEVVVKLDRDEMEQLNNFVDENVGYGATVNIELTIVNGKLKSAKIKNENVLEF